MNKDMFIEDLIANAEEFFGLDLHEYAIAECEAALQLDPQNIRALEILGKSFGNEKMHFLAEKAFREILSIMPEHFEAGRLLLVSLCEQGIYSRFFLRNYKKYAKSLICIWNLETSILDEDAASIRKLKDESKVDYKEFK